MYIIVYCSYVLFKENQLCASQNEYIPSVTGKKYFVTGKSLDETIVFM